MPAETALVVRLKTMLDNGTDNALLRFSLGQAYLHNADPLLAVEHLQRALEHDSSYSAAWKLLGQAYAQAGQEAKALETYSAGIEVATKKGDIQAAKEMQVFARRIQRTR